MQEIDLLDRYPRIRRDIAQRAQWKARTPENRAIARQFGFEYFDGTREQGYGGYRYDGRWKPVVQRLIEHYGLTGTEHILDIGCAKGFLLHDFRELLPGVEVAGIDVSQYALDHAMEDVRPFLRLANATDLPFPDRSFDLVISINVIHNLPEPLCRRAIGEMQRVSRRHLYLQVDAFRNEQERQNLELWQLTAELIYSTDQWKQLLAEEGYTGDVYWTITE
ncbi:MAG TPA: methyltransferase type 11 [Candidatus Omnitrophica bacterium]|nr:MAG: methyltransferase type 11 [Omnitrophica WOR_2 bacterium RIFCSPLOWO2_02_FULL_63_16]OGX47188.1 MAG: methyltransferase type 11 [Omnitrophica WOR_2 bacterium RIFCSPLOWO2_12_FULL_63_16]HBH96812.1 methyltransferase type 11 [Candidatus Omnitrophota bacterium]